MRWRSSEKRCVEGSVEENSRGKEINKGSSEERRKEVTGDMEEEEEKEEKGNNWPRRYKNNKWKGVKIKKKDNEE